VEPIASLLRICAVLNPEAYEVEERDLVLDALRHRLSAVFASIAIVLAASPNQNGWVADEENPGFLVRPVAGLELRVPWHLLRDFPSEEILKDLVAIALKIRSGPDVSLCISGSSTFYRAFHPIGDLDFCEYVDRNSSEEEDRTFARTIHRALSLEDGSLVCLGMRVLSPASLDWVRPWPEQDEELLAKVAKTTEGKCTFIGGFDAEGVLEITKLVLFVDPDKPDLGAGGKSFPLQEAPLSEDGWVPRQIVNPLTIGAYIRWLLRQLEELLDLNLSKAAKRALSLTRLATLESLSERILNLLRQQKLTLISALDSRLILWERINQMSGDSLISSFESPLTETIRKLVEELEEPNLGFPAAGLTYEWCENAKIYLRTRDESGFRARSELRAILDEIAGHFSELAT
jgi:hypothetical protein